MWIGGGLQARVRQLVVHRLGLGNGLETIAQLVHTGFGRRTVHRIDRGLRERVERSGCVRPEHLIVPSAATDEQKRNVLGGNAARMFRTSPELVASERAAYAMNA